jgi:hypothetical protein
MGSTAQLGSLVAMVFVLLVGLDWGLSGAGFRLLDRPDAALAAIAPVFFLGVVFSEVSIYRKLWFYDPRYTTGWTVPRRLPVEQILIDLVIPVAAWVGWSVVHHRTRRVGLSAGPNGTGVRSSATSSSGSTATGARGTDGALESASSGRVKLGVDRGRRVVMTVALVMVGAVAVLAAAAGFARTGEGDAVRGEIRTKVWRIADRLNFELPDLTIFVVAVVAMVVIVEFGLLRSGIWRDRRAIGAVLAALAVAMVLDTWCAKSSSQIVVYAPDEYQWRIPMLRMPVELLLYRLSTAAVVAILAKQFELGGLNRPLGFRRPAASRS